MAMRESRSVIIAIVNGMQAGQVFSRLVLVQDDVMNMSGVRLLSPATRLQTMSLCGRSDMSRQTSLSSQSEIK